MRSFRIITPLVKNKSARTLSIVAGLLLVLMTLAYAYTQVVSKYPTGFVIATASMGTAGMTLEKGSVFGFNSAKSGADTEAYATIQEGACASPATLIDFAEGKEGFVTTTNGTITFSTTGADGRAGPDGAAQTSYVNSTLARTFSWDKKFLWDCGNPTVTSFSMWYRVPTWTAPNTTALANMFQVWIVKPNGQTVNLNVGGAANVQLPQSAITVPWTQLTGTMPAWTFDQPGLYTLRINGAMRGATGAARWSAGGCPVASGFSESCSPADAGPSVVSMPVKYRASSGRAMATRWFGSKRKRLDVGVLPYFFFEILAMHSPKLAGSDPNFGFGQRINRFIRRVHEPVGFGFSKTVCAVSLGSKSVTEAFSLWFGQFIFRAVGQWILSGGGPC